MTRGRSDPCEARGKDAGLHRIADGNALVPAGDAVRLWLLGSVLPRDRAVPSQSVIADGARRVAAAHRAGADVGRNPAQRADEAGKTAAAGERHSEACNEQPQESKGGAGGARRHRRRG